MFDYLNGEIEEILINSVVVEINGIGFLVNTSLKTISEVKLGQRIKLYITEAIGESNFDLYGFADLQEKKFFELLISVSGVGPEAAISLLSSLNTDQLFMAVINDDSKMLTSAPGIGTKIAQRIIMEQVTIRAEFRYLRCCCSSYGPWLQQHRNQPDYSRR